MSWLVWIVLPFVYSAWAAIAVRLMGVEYRPRCRGSNRDALKQRHCDGWWDVYGPCDDCRAHRTFVLSATFWPVTLALRIALVPFRAIAGIRVIPAPERDDTTQVKP